MLPSLPVPPLRRKPGEMRAERDVSEKASREGAARDADKSILNLPSAYNDAMRLGSTRVRIYRLEFKLPGERQITVRVSRVGEILQVQFPGQLVMDNESIPLRKPKEP